MLESFRHHLVSRVIDPVGHWVDHHADTIVAVVVHRITRGIVAWAIARVTAIISLSQAWESFGDPNRPDRNYGHCTIDFGGQWMMGAMLVEGHGRQLYNRTVQRQVVTAHYPRDREDPKAEQFDADKLMSYFMGSDSRSAAETIASFVLPLAAGDALGSLALTAGMQDGWTSTTLAQATAPRLGGPLYPPINAIIYAPLGLVEPHVGYRINQVLNLIWALLAALGVRYLSRGNIWTSVALTIIILYPGFKGSIHLGQNAALTLAIVTWGWALIVRDRPIAGGLVWGFLAFKPVWAAAFFLVPLLTFRIGTCIAMLGMGATLAVITLPFVGVQPWFDWLKVGQDAAELYKTDYNWVHLSRDVLGIPRRWLLDFSLPSSQRDVAIPAVTRSMVCIQLIAASLLLAFFMYRRSLRWLAILTGLLLVLALSNLLMGMVIPSSLFGTVFILLLKIVLAGVTVIVGSLLARPWTPWLTIIAGVLLVLAWDDWLFVRGYQQALGGITAGAIVGWSLFAACLLATVYLAFSRPRQAQAVIGIPAGFLLIGAWLACFHFMYYDVLLTALPLFVLLAEPRRYLEPILFAVVPMKEPPLGEFASYYRAWPPDAPPPMTPVLQPEYRNVWVLNRMVPNVLLLLLLVEHLFPRIGLAGTITGMWLEPLKMTTVQEAQGQVMLYRKVYNLASMRVTTAIYDDGQPFDTYLVILLWLWCGYLWLRTPPMPAPPPAKLPEMTRAPPRFPEHSEEIMER